jgi:hypothetical protein
VLFFSLPLLFPISMIINRVTIIVEGGIIHDGDSGIEGEGVELGLGSCDWVGVGLGVGEADGASSGLL